MITCVFAGPTLSPHEGAQALAATWLPPARHGDVYRAVSVLRPRAIGIIDGYFQWAASVWHKEILWAIHQGVHVFGAASMGALRAAELAAFGMQGVGRIYEAYRDGVLAGCGDEPFEDDDEVAVTHGPAESGYLAASEAMVNIRCTLAGAETAGAISAATRVRLAAIAKALYFPDRSYESLLERASAEAFPAEQLAALREWLPGGRVNQKRCDAIAMLGAMQTFLAGDPPPAQAGFVFEHTTLWERVVAAARPTMVRDPEEARVLEELRLEAERWDALRNDALRGEVPPALVEREVLARIRDTAEFERLRARAEDKTARIAARAGLPEVEEFSELQLLELRDWYFSRVLGRDMPDDIMRCVAEWGYADLTHFHRAIFSEYVYRQHTDGSATPRAATSGS